MGLIPSTSIPAITVAESNNIALGGVVVIATPGVVSLSPVSTSIERTSTIITQSIQNVDVPYVLTQNSSSDVYSDVNAFDDSIYRVLSMQDDMKIVTVQGRVNNEFGLFLKYGERLTAGQEVGPEFIAFNSYLGSLGV